MAVLFKCFIIRTLLKGETRNWKLNTRTTKYSVFQGLSFINIKYTYTVLIQYFRFADPVFNCCDLKTNKDISIISFSNEEHVYYFFILKFHDVTMTDRPTPQFIYWMVSFYEKHGFWGNCKMPFGWLHLKWFSVT